MFTIVESQEFQDQVIDQLGSLEVWDQLRAAVDCILAKNPYVHKFNSQGQAVSPLLNLVYEVDSANRRILYKELAPAIPRH